MKKLFFHSVLLLIIAAVVEGGALGILAVLRAKNYLYEVPRKTQDLDYATRLRIRDPVLGWPLKEGRDAPGGTYRDLTGARRLPAFPDPASPSCVSLYGDSFVESVELDHEHAAANLLAEAIACRVANFGQAGYGTDQALLRYRLNSQDEAGTVVLGHMLENILRNLNRNRDLLTGGRDYHLKPRFILDSGGKLELIPLPHLTEAEYDQSIGQRTPLLRLEHENFQPGGGLVGPMPGFPYLFSLIRNLDNYGLHARIRGYPSKYAEFYRPDHPTQALELTVGIIKAFRDESARRNQEGVVLLMPTLQDLSYHDKTGVWVHRALTDRLDREGIPYMDYGPYLVAHHDRDFAEYYTASGHYNQRGDALLARMMAERLASKVKRMLPRGSASAPSDRVAGAPVHPVAGVAGAEERVAHEAESRRSRHPFAQTPLPRMAVMQGGKG